jgi:hypothetical protein
MLKVIYLILKYFPVYFDRKESWDNISSDFRKLSLPKIFNSKPSLFSARTDTVSKGEIKSQLVYIINAQPCLSKQDSQLFGPRLLHRHHNNRLIFDAYCLYCFEC